MRLLRGIVSFGCGVVGLVACATGREMAATFSQDGSGGSLGAGGGGAADPSSSSSASSTTADASSSATSGAGGAGGPGGAGGAGGSGGASGGGAGGAAGCDHSAPDTCLTAVEIPSILGDADSDTRVLQGTTAAWYKLLVKEVSLLSNQVSYTATLVSPPGMQFKLFVYTGNSSMPSCIVSAEVAPGDPPSITSVWSDTANYDDSRWITFEVRYISGEVCAPPPSWTLTIKGHTK